MRIPKPPSPPFLSLPQDSDDYAHISQPPLCTPVDQPVQRTNAVTASPIRTLAKRRRTNLHPVPPLELHPSSAHLSLPVKTRHHPKSQVPKFLYRSMSLNDDDSQAANSQSFSQRDLPEMSQDTLALFPNLVRDHHRRATSKPPPQSPSNTVNKQKFDTAPARPPPVNTDPSTDLAKASMLSTLSGSEALCNPFLDAHPPGRTCHGNPSPLISSSAVLRTIRNASESFQDFGAEISLEDAVGATDKLNMSRISLSAKSMSRKMEEEKLLKLLLVSCSQGRKLSLDFVVRGVAGKGAFSEVFRVTHRLDGTTYAVKKNLVPLVTNCSRKEAIREVFALSALQGHPNIIRYQDAWFEEKGRFLFIQTEFLSKGSLYSMFIEPRRPMNAGELFYLALDISQALSHMHNRGIVHLDVKPDNIFQSDRGLERASYVIGDFGLACHKDGCDARSTEGDARYLCPEGLQETSLAASTTSIDPNGTTRKRAMSDLRAGDIFSLGVTLYELGTGVPLEKNSSKQHGPRESLRNMATEVGTKCGSAIIEDIVRRCLEPDPRRRATAGDICGMCISLGSLEVAATRECQERHVRETERKLEECRAYLRSLLKKGEAGREQFRRRYSKGSARAPSRVMSR